MSGPDDLAGALGLTPAQEAAAGQPAAPNGRRPGPEVMFDPKGKLLLPPSPRHDDPAGLCAWLTIVFALDPAHPVTGAVREGRRGADGHVTVYRAHADTIRFEPATRISTPPRLVETLSWSTLPTDDAVHAFTAVHCRQISHVVRMLCGLHDTLSAEQEAESIIGTFLQGATPIDGCTTYGTSGQRYEAAMSLRHAGDDRTGRADRSARYLIDAKTDELVIAVSDLQEAARRHEGSSVPHGWLDGRMETLGWKRITLDGHSLPGRNGRRQGHHARIDAYRGELHETVDEPEEEPDPGMPEQHNDEVNT